MPKRLSKAVERVLGLEDPAALDQCRWRFEEPGLAREAARIGSRRCPPSAQLAGAGDTAAAWRSGPRRRRIQT